MTFPSAKTANNPSKGRAYSSSSATGVISLFASAVFAVITTGPSSVSQDGKSIYNVVKTF